MNSLVFFNSAVEPVHKELLIDFASAIDSKITYTKEYEKCDIAVIFGSWKKYAQKETAPHHQLKNDITINHRGKLLVIETPLLNRTITKDHKYYRVGLNHFMRGLADFKNYKSNSDRFDDLNIKVKPWRDKGEHVLLIGQNMSDASLSGLNMAWWIENTIKMLLKNTDREIIVRDHPENKRKLKETVDRFNYTNRVSYDKNVNIKDSLHNSWCTVSYTSGSSVDSIIEGIPVITCSEHNFIWPISSHSLEDVENPKCNSREQLLYDLAYTQWSVEEIRQGKPWKHLI